MLDWIEVVAGATEARWATGKPLFLAQIPGELRKHDIELSAILAGRSLREAISIDASHRLRLVQDPNNLLSWGVIPRSAPTGTNLDQLFRKPSQSEKAASTQPRYKRWFFTAFIKPISPYHRRWISNDGFDDLPKSDPAPPGAVEVERTAPIRTEPNVLVDNTVVHQAIRDWATGAGVNLEVYYSTSVHPKHSAANLSSLFSLAFEALSDDDLKRVMIPLDIIVKLLRR